MINNIHIIAQAAAEQPQGSPLGTFVPMILIIVIFYFILIRPQRKQAKELKERQNALKPGDKVISAGGIYGIIREVQEEAVKMEVAPNTVIKIRKSQIVHSVGKDGSPEN